MHIPRPAKAATASPTARAPRLPAHDGNGYDHRQPATLSLCVAYLLWLPPMGLFGAHLFYLRRRQHATVAAFTINFLVLGWLADLFRAPGYVQSANSANSFNPVATPAPGYVPRPGTQRTPSPTAGLAAYRNSAATASPGRRTALGSSGRARSPSPLALPRRDEHAAPSGTTSATNSLRSTPRYPSPHARTPPAGSSPRSPAVVGSSSPLSPAGVTLSASSRSSPTGPAAAAATAPAAATPASPSAPPSPAASPASTPALPTAPPGRSASDAEFFAQLKAQKEREEAARRRAEAEALEKLTPEEREAREVEEAERLRHANMQQRMLKHLGGFGNSAVKRGVGRGRRGRGRRGRGGR